jgi:hypothetical protein
MSRLLPIRIQRGYGFTTDNSAVLNKHLTVDQLEEPLIKAGALYRLRPDVGRFEMVGFTGGGKDVKYQFKHILSGDTFNVSKKMMHLLFQKDSSS